MTYQPTTKQKEHTDLIENYKYVMVYGGARSGKTINTLVWMINRALASQCSQAVIRTQREACSKYVFRFSLQDALALIDPSLNENIVIDNETMAVTFANGSVISFFGLDEDHDDILKQKFSTIYLNECSQVQSFTTVFELIECLDNHHEIEPKMLFDLNPPSGSHWSHDIFLHVAKSSKTCAAIQMNPRDNPYLGDDYLSQFESSLPQSSRLRYIEGEFE